jgi:coenzyme PQQ synthesis protein D (PqqD)
MTSMILPAAVFKCAEGVSCQSFGDDDEGVVLSIDSGVLYACNASALAFLQTLDGQRTFEQIATAFADRYRIGGPRAAEDLSRLADTLLGEQLIVRVA